MGIKIAKKKDRRRHKRDHGDKMKTLNLDTARCTGRFRDGKWCIHRLTCQRFLAWAHWDRKAGLTDYRGISVPWARELCNIKIEIEGAVKGPSVDYYSLRVLSSAKNVRF